MTLIFGYGSLIWKADFPFQSKRKAYILNYVRRFWQSSTDHRGTKSDPGRVVTILHKEEWQEKFKEQDDCSSTDRLFGVCFEIADDDKEAVFDYLNIREQNGYVLENITVYVNDDSQTDAITDVKYHHQYVPKPCLIYIASSDNSSFLGPAPLKEIAEHIHRCEGPSGTNRDYLLNLFDSMEEFEDDEHLKELTTLVRNM